LLSGTAGHRGFRPPRAGENLRPVDDVNTALRQAVDDIGQIVRRDGGVLDFASFDPATAELIVTFRTAPNDECSACTIDEATVRAFLEEAVAVQGVGGTSLRIETPQAPEAPASSLRLEVLNPTADGYGTDVAELTARPPSLQGQTIGLLWNGKPNGDIALRAIGAELEARFEGLRTRFYSGSIPCDRTLLDLAAAECSAVVACTADCGSCSSWMTHDAIALERAGVPAVVVVSKGFEEDVAASARAFALPDVRSVVVPEVYNNATEAVSIQQSLDAVPGIIDRLTGAIPAAGASTEGPRSPADLSFTGDSPTELFEEFNRSFLDRDWGDGYPLLPPTRAAVASLLHDIADPDRVLYTLPPGNGQVTPRKIAVACAMTGATAPEMAVVEAVLRAFNDPQHGQRLRTVLMSTSAHAPFVLVNGPIARSLGINGGRACIGPGAQNRVNLRIGRAVTLALKNLGSWYPGVLDMDTIGSVRKNVVVISENVDESPWTPFHVDAGHAADESTVTLFITLGEADVGFQGHLDAHQLARSISSFDSVQGGYFSGLFGGENARTSPTGRLLLLSPPHAHALAEGGITKDSFRDLLFEHGHQPLARVLEQWRKLYLDGKTFPEWSWAFELSEEEQQRRTLSVVRDREHYTVAVCGSTRGKDMFLPTALPPVTAAVRTDWSTPQP
jgi:Fe-S cluster biogenesis protein NfuA